METLRRRSGTTAPESGKTQLINRNAEILLLEEGQGVPIAGATSVEGLGHLS